MLVMALSQEKDKCARKLGATQRQSAKAIGKSRAWVNMLLKWRRGGYRETPFGPQSKAKHEAVQSPKQSRRPMTAEEALAQRAQAEFQTVRAVAVAILHGGNRTAQAGGPRSFANVAGVQTRQ